MHGKLDNITDQWTASKKMTNRLIVDGPDMRCLTLDTKSKDTKSIARRGLIIHQDMISGLRIQKV